jgi:SAM-dependent methyltransferase
MISEERGRTIQEAEVRSTSFTKAGNQVATANAKYQKKEFWSEENLKYVEPHFRLTKAARIVNKLAKGRECELLDVGCGPCTLARLLDSHIHYYGIDIAIHKPASNLLEVDFSKNRIGFGDRRFDIIVAQGVFEYIGACQPEKFGEIAQLLKAGGNFLVSYVNFNHRCRNIYWPYNNIQTFDEFRRGLQQFFLVDRYFPTSQRWHHDEPKGRFAKVIQMHLSVNVPVISRLLAVEYFFICSARS